ncbi:MAG: hypothetical protein AVDCRST_MAG04-3080, partial [uncultured Acetobacteraceae bacterium]
GGPALQRHRPRLHDAGHGAASTAGSARPRSWAAKRFGYDPRDAAQGPEGDGIPGGARPARADAAVARPAGAAVRLRGSAGRGDAARRGGPHRGAHRPAGLGRAAPGCHSGGRTALGWLPGRRPRPRGGSRDALRQPAEPGARPARQGDRLRLGHLGAGRGRTALPARLRPDGRGHRGGGGRGHHRRARQRPGGVSARLLPRRPADPLLERSAAAAGSFAACAFGEHSARLRRRPPLVDRRAAHRHGAGGRPVLDRPDPDRHALGGRVGRHRGAPGFHPDRRAGVGRRAGGVAGPGTGSAPGAAGGGPLRRHPGARGQRGDAAGAVARGEPPAGAAPGCAAHLGAAVRAVGRGARRPARGGDAGRRPPGLRRGLVGSRRRQRCRSRRRTPEGKGTGGV